MRNLIFYCYFTFLAITQSLSVKILILRKTLGGSQYGIVFAISEDTD